MSTVLSKKQMTEEDIKLNYITPAIMKGWKGHITMETKSRMVASISVETSWLVASLSLLIICFTSTTESLWIVNTFSDKFF